MVNTKGKKFLAGLTAMAIVMSSTTLAFASGEATTLVNKTATTANVTVGSNDTQSASYATTTTAVSAGVDLTQTGTMSDTVSNDLGGADNTQSLTEATVTPNSTGSIQTTDIVFLDFTGSYLGTVNFDGTPVAFNFGEGFNPGMNVAQSVYNDYLLSPNPNLDVSYTWPSDTIRVSGKVVNTPFTVDANSSPYVSFTPVQAASDVAKQVTHIFVSTGSVVEVGDKFSIDVDGANHLVDYVASEGDTNNNVITGLFDAISNYAGSGALPYVFSIVDDSIVMEAKNAGVGFDVAVSATNRAPVIQKSLVTVGGSWEAGDLFEVSMFNSNGDGIYTIYTALEGATTSDIALGVYDRINSAIGGIPVDFELKNLSANTFEVDSTVPGKPIALTVNTINKPAVAQVSEITLGGTIETGDKFTVDLPVSPDLVYTALTGATANSIATAIAGLLSGNDYLADNLTVTSDADKVILTSKTAGETFSANASASNRTAVAQVDTYDFSSVTAGDTVVIDINGKLYNYTVNNGNLASDIVTGLITAINSDSNAVVIASGTNSLVLTAKVAGTAFTSTGSALVTGSVNKTVNLKSGWNVFSTPQVLSAISFSNLDATGLAFYKLEGGTWNGNTVAPTIRNVKPLEGFIVYNSNPSEIQTYLTYATGLEPARKIFQKNLSAGWNILGVTTTSTPFASIGVSATSAVDFTNGSNSLNAVSETFGIRNSDANVVNPQLSEAYAVFLSNTGIYGGSQGGAD